MIRAQRIKPTKKIDHLRRSCIRRGFCCRTMEILYRAIQVLRILIQRSVQCRIFHGRSWSSLFLRHLHQSFSSDLSKKLFRRSMRGLELIPVLRRSLTSCCLTHSIRLNLGELSSHSNDQHGQIVTISSTPSITVGLVRRNGNPMYRGSSTLTKL